MPYSYELKSERERTKEIFERIGANRYVTMPKTAIQLPKEAICLGDKTRHYYFAYGANLSKAGMHSRCPGWKPCSVGQLYDHRLVFRGVADVIKAKGHSVRGMIYELTDRHFKTLDVFEGYPNFYDRRVVSVQGFNCIMYYMQNNETPYPPGPGYKQTITNGLRDWHLPIGSHFKNAICGHDPKPTTQLVVGSELYGVYNTGGYTIYDECNQPLKNKDMKFAGIAKIKNACERFGARKASRSQAKWLGAFEAGA